MPDLGHKTSSTSNKTTVSAAGSADAAQLGPILVAQPQLRNLAPPPAHTRGHDCEYPQATTCPGRHAPA